jgi:RNA-splicing ligase RtcB
MLVIDGEYTTAHVFLPEAELEAATREQIQAKVNHPSMTQPVRVMPDTHWGQGATIGFTMPLDTEQLRVVPNVIGVDIGCGLRAFNLGQDHRLQPVLDDAVREGVAEDIHAAIDAEIRERVPFGRSVHTRGDYHMRDDFPWSDVSATLDSFSDALGVDVRAELDWFDGYGIEYFNALCERVGVKTSRAINSMGTLGGGNHFIELGESVETGDLWVVVHSGSRKPGLEIATYWQDRAHAIHDDRAERIREHLAQFDPRYYAFDLDTVSDDDLLTWVTGGKGEDFKQMDAIVDDYIDSDPDTINVTRDKLQLAAAIAQEPVDGDPLDWLEGPPAYGYLVDMMFAQRYASESRRLMAEAVADVLETSPTDDIEAVHNFIDFADLTIRKGACPARDGQRIVIPFNMEAGTLIARGKGNADWNRSAPHGAGRVMSRRQAHRELDVEEFRERMGDVYSTSVGDKTLDEAPMAYKDAALIEDAITPTAEIIDRLRPVHNLKATE